MLSEVSHVQSGPQQDVAVTEGVVFTTYRRIQLLVNVRAYLARNFIQAGITLTMHHGLDVAEDFKPAVHTAYIKMHVCGPREIKALERFERYVVIDHDVLPASGQQAADIDYVRLNHKPLNNTRPVKAPIGPSHCRAHPGACQTPGSGGWTGAMTLSATTTDLAAHGVRFAPEIATAAQANRIDPRLLAAVAAQETGGPGSNAGANIVGDGGHGHGVFQIDDRWHAFATTPKAMDPGANAQYAAKMLRGLLDRNGGDVHAALSSYNAGDPHATGTTTRWGDGKVLGYADSVLRHEARLGGSYGGAPPAGGACATPEPQDLLSEAIAEGPTTSGSVNALSNYHTRSYRDLVPAPAADPLALLFGSDPS